MVSNPSELPPPGRSSGSRPYVAAMVLGPADYIGPVMELCQGRRGELGTMEYLSEERVELRYQAPAGRDHLRLLRPAEVAHPGLRVARLRAERYREADLVKVGCCSGASRSTPSRPSSTRTRPTPTAGR